MIGGINERQRSSVHRQVMSSKAIAALVGLTALGMFVAAIALGWILDRELVWINLTAIEIGKCADPAFWVRIFDLKLSILLRVLTICAGASVMLGGMATSHVMLARDSVASTQARGAKATLASASPGIFGLAAGGLVVCFALSQKSQFAPYASPIVDWCTQISKGIAVTHVGPARTGDGIASVASNPPPLPAPPAKE